jgi:hypothetical protein
MLVSAVNGILSILTGLCHEVSVLSTYKIKLVTT